MKEFQILQKCGRGNFGQFVGVRVEINKSGSVTLSLESVCLFSAFF